MAYKELRDGSGTVVIMIRHPLGYAIPLDLLNADYRAYQDWLAQGNTVEPADPPPALPALLGVDFATQAQDPAQMSSAVGQLRTFLATAGPTTAEVVAALKILIRLVLFMCKQLVRQML